MLEVELEVGVGVIRREEVEVEVRVRARASLSDPEEECAVCRRKLLGERKSSCVERERVLLAPLLLYMFSGQDDDGKEGARGGTLSETEDRPSSPKTRVVSEALARSNSTPFPNLDPH